MNTTTFDVSKLNLQIIDASMNMFPDVFVNATGITFTRKVLEEMNYLPPTFSIPPMWKTRCSPSKPAAA